MVDVEGLLRGQQRLDQTGRDVLVGRVSEMDGVYLQPYGNASRADEAGKVTIPIREAVSGIEDDAPRKGCLQAASAARNGRAEDLAEILISAILKMALVTAALSGDVAAKWQTAYQGLVATSLSQEGQLLQDLLESRLRSGYQATCNVPFTLPVPLRFGWQPILVAAHEQLARKGVNVHAILLS